MAEYSKNPNGPDLSRPIYKTVMVESEPITYACAFCPKCGDYIVDDDDRCRTCQWTSDTYRPKEKQWVSHPRQRFALWESSCGRCAYCGEYQHDYSSRTVDHIVPQSRGGTHDASNLLPCCKSCNARKRGRTLEEYRSYLRSKHYELNDYQLEWLCGLGIAVSNEDAPTVVFAFESDEWHDCDHD